jgi:hypothetical protein
MTKLHMDLTNKVAPVFAAGVLAASAMPAFAGDAGAGEQVFSGNCAACHAGGQNVIMPEKTLQVRDALQTRGGAQAARVTRPGKERARCSRVRAALGASTSGVPSVHRICVRCTPADAVARPPFPFPQPARGTGGVPGGRCQREVRRLPGHQRQERHARLRWPPLGRGH